MQCHLVACLACILQILDWLASPYVTLNGCVGLVFDNLFQYSLSFSLSLSASLPTKHCVPLAFIVLNSPSEVRQVALILTM